MWLVAAAGSAIFAGITAVLAKLGIRNTDSDVATAIRTIVVLAFSWLMAGIAGQIGTVGSIGPRSWLFLALSGIATGASWICYYYAIQTGVVSVVVPIDKLSALVSMAFAYFVFRERFTKRTLVGLALTTTATLAMAIWA